MGSAPDIRITPLRMQKSWMKNYTYVVSNLASGESLVIDPAWEKHKITEVLAITKTRLTGILLTHAHPDHTHLAVPLVEEYGCPVWMSDAEIRHSQFWCPSLHPIYTEDRFTCATIPVQPFIVPGHSPGSVCYLIDQALFTGDTLFSEGCGACVESGSDPHALFMSLQRLKTFVPHNTRIFPGHSFGVAPGKTFRDILGINIYLHLNTKDAFVAYRMRPGQTHLLDFKWGEM